jgi:hypothetical protein
MIMGTFGVYLAISARDHEGVRSEGGRLAIEAAVNL